VPQTPTDPNAPYYNLSPEAVLAAVESVGHRSDARLLALNSYENRVYQVGMEDGPPLIAKFYRPGRWTDAAIVEEHDFTDELAQQEIPVVAPLRDETGASLCHHAGFRFALYPRRGGHWPELDRPDNLRWLGRFLARIHAVGATRPFQHRPRFSREEFGHDPRRFLLEQGFIPDHLTEAYSSLTTDLLARIDTAFDRTGPVREIRLHGDCHPGNILWTRDGAHFVDFDDCRSGPAIQDLWMLLSGERDEMERQLGYLIEGYSRFHDLDPRELQLIEALRTLRMIHYAGWIARRWQDPAFPHGFPWFGSTRYWEDHVLSLREQAARLDEPPLQLY